MLFKVIRKKCLCRDYKYLTRPFLELKIDIYSLWIYKLYSFFKDYSYNQAAKKLLKESAK